MAARLVASSVPPQPLSAAARADRATAARVWFASLALPANTRMPFARLVDTTAEEQPQGLDAALAAVLDVAGAYLDGSSRGELDQLLLALRA